MSITTATSTTGDVLSQLRGTFVLNLAKLVGHLPQEEVRSSEVRIKTYTPVLYAANAWLSVVEERIRASIRPNENEGGESTEWLNSHAAAEAISFFRSVADLLPTEPHISATRSGDLVAEFETSICTMTSVVSDRETVLFGISNSDPDKPVQTVIRRGSNRLREELKTFTRELSVSHGKQMVAS
jgi:hypothetical protein